MVLKQLLEIFELLDKADANGYEVAAFLRSRGTQDVEVKTVKGPKGSTDAIKVLIRGSKGKAGGGTAPTLGVIGRLGGLGARPEIVGFVSDGDGALAALAVALKLADMQKNGDLLKGDVIVTTHICPDAPTKEHRPVPFMDSPIDIKTMNELEVTPAMDAILSIDTTKGNRVINTRGFAISPTIKEGYILKTSDDLLDIMTRTTGKLPIVFPVTHQDITPYGNGLYHLNSILQPAVATSAPVVGVAITAEMPVPGCATGASHPLDIEGACRFVIEVAKSFGDGKCEFYNKDEYTRITQLYGDLKRFQTMGAVESE
ncbi:MAG: DUF1177 domain-containing protein [Bacillota bacterium]|uniref:DUF1177 family protein n=1 Tax=Thermanaerosceptrum fracticalcis TaxID=1712410 RepID=A0A7G6DYY2_THEFR|nr:DUF1177 domain-containing protein [Thermanaerosceptrum fracticalcis]QNB45036.1 DUF1177 family protein [Thermanaerosceptrum fracticalcis]